MAEASDVRVAENAEARRFEAYVSDELAGVLEYIPLAGKIIATHTEVGESFEGRGVGSRLVSATLDQLRADGRVVQPLCPYVTAYLRKHPEYADVVDQSTPH